MCNVYISVTQMWSYKPPAPVTCIMLTCLCEMKSSPLLLIRHVFSNHNVVIIVLFLHRNIYVMDTYKLWLVIIFIWTSLLPCTHQTYHAPTIFFRKEVIKTHCAYWLMLIIHCNRRSYCTDSQNDQSNVKDHAIYCIYYYVIQ